MQVIADCDNETVGSKAKLSALDRILDFFYRDLNDERGEILRATFVTS